ncbi:MAG: CoA transferase [Pseudomonadota bacterium]
MEDKKSPASAAATPSVLAGISVLDLSNGVAGQFAGRLLAEHGADVLLLEPPAGTDTRRPLRLDDTHLFWHLNTGKRSLALDRGTPQGRAQFEKLLARADVVLGDTGEDFAPYAATHPTLVACAIREFTAGGPYENWQGSEMIHQALSGLMFTTGHADKQPLYGFGYRAYYSTGAAAVSAIVGGLLLRLRTGCGQLLPISVHEVAVGMSQNPVAQYSYNGTGMTRGPYPGACDMFECTDGWVSMFCKGDRWKAFCAALDHAEMTADPRFTAINVVVKNWAAAYAILAPTVRQLSSDAFIAKLTGARCLASKVNTMADVLACGHQQARGFWEKVTDEQGRERALLGPVFRLSATPRQVRSGAPALHPVGEASGPETTHG